MARMQRTGSPRASSSRLAVAVLALTLPLGSLPTHADTTSLVSVADTGLLELEPDFNLGAQEDVPAGTLGSTVQMARSRLLLRFDLTALPTGARLQAAHLRLTVTRAPAGGGASSIFTLHRLLREWQEGDRQGGLPGGSEALPGQATWNSPSAPSPFWQAPGALAGADFATDSSSSERILGPGSFEFEFGSSQLAEIQAWIENPATNFGWILLTRTEDVAQTARRFATREHTDPAARPNLLLQFESPNPIEPPLITGIARADGTTLITVRVTGGVNYALEGATAVPATNWLNLSSPIMTNQSGYLVFPDLSPPSIQRYYRVAATP